MEVSCCPEVRLPLEVNRAGFADRRGASIGCWRPIKWCDVAVCLFILALKALALSDMRKERGIDRQSADISKRLDGRLALKRSRQKDFRICQAFCLDNGHAFTRMFELDETVGEGDGLGQPKQEAVASIPQLLANVRGHDKLSD